MTEAPKRSGHEAERPEQPAAPEGSRLLPVRVVASAPKARSEMVNTGLLKLVLPSGAKLRFQAGTDLGHLLELTAAL